MPDENLGPLELSNAFHSMGYWEGFARSVAALPRRGNRYRHQAFLSDYQLGTKPNKHLLSECAWLAKQLKGGQHVPELIVLLLRSGQCDKARGALAKFIGLCNDQGGRFIQSHPGAVLDLIEGCLGDLEDRDAAILLLNGVISSRKAFALTEDLRRAARLLVELRAPIMLWADWGGLFINHVLFSIWRKQWMEEQSGVEKGGLQWAAEEERRSEGVLLEALKIGPPMLGTILSDLSDRLNAGLSPAINERAAKGTSKTSEKVPEAFISNQCLRFRFPWFEYLSPSEQNFLFNGEWALLCSPTPDYSMGLAQWWRTMESCLNRVLITPLAQLLQSDPSALAADKQQLSEKKQKDEAIFLERLVDPVKSKKLTLSDILLVLNKCVPAGDGKAAQSKLRCLATDFVQERLVGTERLVKDRWLNPRKLTSANIDDFRNRASHDRPVEVAQAAVGRTLARMFFSDFYEPFVGAHEWKPAMLGD